MKRLILILLASCGAVYAQQNALLMPWTPQQFTNTNGTVLANGKVCTYQAGTSTGLATYTDSTASVANNVPPNAILLDSTGRPTSGGIWLKVSVAYKITVLTAGSDSTCNTGVVIKTQDQVVAPAGASLTGNNTFTGINTFTGGGSLQGTYTGGPTFTIAASPTGATESGTTVTITTTAPCSFVASQAITISGVGVSGYNGGFTTLTGCGGGSTFTYKNTTTGLAGSGNGSAIGSPLFNDFTVNGPLSVTGTITAPSIAGLANINNIFYVDGVKYTTIQSAITAANPSPGTGCSNANLCGVVIIPPEYAGTDTFTNANLVTVWDWRRQLATGFPQGTLGFPGGIMCGFVSGFVLFPASTDCRIMSFGPADTYVSKSKVAATTTATLNPGANTNVLISAVVNSSIDFSNIQTGTALNLLSTAANQGLFIGRETAAAENLTFNSTLNCPTASTWNVVDATHLCLNVANTHSGTTDIEQGPGALKLDVGGLQLRTAQVRPGQDATNNLMAYVSDNLGNVSFAIPGNNASAPFPANNVTFPFGHGPCIMQTATVFGGNFPVPSAATCFTLGTNSALQATNSVGGFPGFIGPFISNNANAAGFPAMVRIANTDTIAWRNNANSGDIPLGKNTTDQLQFNSQNVTVNVCTPTSQKSESAADANVLTCAIPAQAGTYRISFVLSVSAANTATLGWTATWTDSNGSAQAPTNLSLFQNGVAAPALTFVQNGGTVFYGSATVDVNNAGTSIVVKLTFSGTSFTAKASAVVERII